MALRIRMPKLMLALVLALGLPCAGAAADEVPSAKLKLQSSAALVLDQGSGRVLYGKNTHAIVPIASITKLMTAMVVLDANLDPNEPVAITEDDVDNLRGTHSRLKVGTALAREDLLRLALMASENRAASALARAYPGGRESFVQAMNLKAQLLGMSGSRFSDSTGLSSANVSTAEELSRLVSEAYRYDKIREHTTAAGYEVNAGGRRLAFRNTNGLVSSRGWDIGVSKTGFINESGRNLVMQATLAGRAVVIVLLNSWGKYSRQGDAQRIRKWLEVAAGVAPAPRRTVSGRARRHLSSSATGGDPSG
ncbi:MAG: serine hydrolase [Betaproteobacteria bacterium]|nr:serine hydrolase [Betaproteobacteria bacterium]